MSENKIHGLLLINKNKDCTSHQMVQEVRQILQQKSIGHAGTLDPMARGLLVILCGMATKLSSYFLMEDKRYRLSLKFGLETKTFDVQGEVVRSQSVSLKEKDIKDLLSQGLGELEIPVPIFSAVKVKGRKLYSYAFAGQEQAVQIPLKKMSFWDLDIHNIKKDSVDLSISCSKGSYIRSWAHYLGQKIQTGACLTQLERALSGSFSLEHSLTLEELKKKISQKNLQNSRQLKNLLGSSFLFPTEALRRFPDLDLTEKDARILQHGRVPSYILTAKQADQIEVNKSGQPQILKALRREKLIALLEIKPYEKIKILRNFPNQI